MTQKHRRILVYAALGIGLIGLCVVRVLIDRPPGGPVGLAWPAESGWLRYRLNSVAVALAVGAALALAGLLLQTLLHNPLASPYILGLSSGAGLGVMVFAFTTQVLSWSAWWSAVPVGVPAFLGAAAILLVVFLFGQRAGRIDPLTIVLVGVVISAMCNAMIMFLQHLAPGGVITDVLRWMFGRIDQGITLGSIVTVFAIVIACAAVSWAMAGALDATSLSDDEARSIGVPLGWVRFVMFGAAGVLTAVSVAIAGPIGFVGIIGPHTARLLVGAPHRHLIPVSCLCGSILLLAADVATQFLIVGGSRLPVGVFTAMLGGPFFIWLLRSRRVWS